MARFEYSRVQVGAIGQIVLIVVIIVAIWASLKYTGTDTGRLMQDINHFWETPMKKPNIFSK